MTTFGCLAVLVVLSLFARCEAKNSCGTKTWIFGAVTDVFKLPPGEDKGQIIGYELELALIPAVCKIANRRCKIIGVAEDACAFDVRDRFYVGIGLLDGLIDGCLQYSISIERANNAKFTFPYRNPGKRGMYVRSGNPFGVDSNGGDFRMGYFQTSFGNIQCLNRIGRVFTEVQGFQYPEDLRQGLLNDEVEVIIQASGSSIAGMEEIGKPFRCDILGTAIMVNVDSKLPDWFNPAFKTLVQNGGYKDVCDSVASPSCLKKIRKVIHKFTKNDLLVH